jgi:hypothetical protein
MRDIENSEGISDGIMFVIESDVRYRHIKTCEWDHFSVEGYMEVVESD